MSKYHILVKLTPNVRNFYLSVIKSKQLQTPTTVKSNFTSTNFFNTNFFNFKNQFMSNEWVLIGTTFNGNSAELAQLREWKLAPILDAEIETPLNLIIRKRYRSWAMKHSISRFDRRRNRKLLKPRTSLKRKLSSIIPTRKLTKRLKRKKMAKNRKKKIRVLRRTVQYHFKSPVSSFFLRKTRRYFFRKFLRQSVRKIKLSHWKRKIRRFKRINFKLKRAKSRFLNNLKRSSRTKFKSLARTILKSSDLTAILVSVRY